MDPNNPLAQAARALTLPSTRSGKARKGKWTKDHDGDIVATYKRTSKEVPALDAETAMARTVLASAKQVARHMSARATGATISQSEAAAAGLLVSLLGGPDKAVQAVDAAIKHLVAQAPKGFARTSVLDARAMLPAIKAGLDPKAVKESEPAARAVLDAAKAKAAKAALEAAKSANAEEAAAWVSFQQQ